MRPHLRFIPTVSHPPHHRVPVVNVARMAMDSAVRIHCWPVLTPRGWKRLIEGPIPSLNTMETKTTKSR